eukprot:scaffold4392_cov138-Skeletonema_marinoi.AAC.19
MGVLDDGILRTENILCSHVAGLVAARLACSLPFGLEGSIPCLEEKISDKRYEIQMKVDGYDIVGTM